MARVVLADDHELMRKLLRTVLSARPGLEVVGEAADGPEAIELVRTLEPDLIVLDLAMPGMDGLQVANAVRAARPECAILVLSAFEAEHAAAAAIAAGADRYVEKAAGLHVAAEAAAALVKP